MAALSKYRLYIRVMRGSFRLGQSRCPPKGCSIACRNEFAELFEASLCEVGNLNSEEYVNDNAQGLGSYERGGFACSVVEISVQQELCKCRWLMNPLLGHARYVAWRDAFRESKNGESRERRWVF